MVYKSCIEVYSFNDDSDFKGFSDIPIICLFFKDIISPEDARVIQDEIDIMKFINGGNNLDIASENREEIIKEICNRLIDNELLYLNYKYNIVL